MGDRGETEGDGDDPVIVAAWEQVARGTEIIREAEKDLEGCGRDAKATALFEAAKDFLGNRADKR